MNDFNRAYWLARRLLIKIFKINIEITSKMNDFKVFSQKHNQVCNHASTQKLKSNKKVKQLKKLH